VNLARSLKSSRLKLEAKATHKETHERRPEKKGTGVHEDALVEGIRRTKARPSRPAGTNERDLDLTHENKSGWKRGASSQNV